MSERRSGTDPDAESETGTADPESDPEPRPMLATVSQKAVLFDPEGRLLVLREADGDWEFPGGRIDRGEAAMPALHRELDEETGLSVDVFAPVYTAVRERPDKEKFFVYYRCATDQTDVSLSEEHVDWTWTTPEGARDRLNDRGRAALDRALDDES